MAELRRQGASRTSLSSGPFVRLVHHKPTLSAGKNGSEGSGLPKACLPSKLGFHAAGLLADGSSAVVPPALLDEILIDALRVRFDDEGRDRFQAVLS